MARYIDAEKIVFWIRHVSKDGLEDDVRKIAFSDEIARMPTADVAPRAEVANKICCEIEAEIVAALQSNYRAKQERVEKQLPDDFVSYMCEGKIAALRGMEAFVEELKNKYAEGRNE